jgi:hypothetical protein
MGCLSMTMQGLTETAPPGSARCSGPEGQPVVLDGSYEE